MERDTSKFTEMKKQVKKNYVLKGKEHFLKLIFAAEISSKEVTPGKNLL